MKSKQNHHQTTWHSIKFAQNAKLRIWYVYRQTSNLGYPAPASPPARATRAATQTQAAVTSMRPGRERLLATARSAGSDGHAAWARAAPGDGEISTMAARHHGVGSGVRCWPWYAPGSAHARPLRGGGGRGDGGLRGCDDALARSWRAPAIFSFLYKKNQNFQKYMSVSKIFENIPRSPLGG